MFFNLNTGYVLGLGLIQLGRPWGVSPRNALLSDDETVTLIKGALSLGVTFFDTAPAYGASEAKLAQALSSIHTEVYVATKFGEYWDELSRSSFSDHRLEAAVASVARSLAILGKVGLLQVHKCSRQVLEDSALIDFLLVLRRLGVAVGASVGDPDGLDAALSAGIFDAVQFPLNVEDGRFTTMLPKLLASNVTPIINRPFAMGSAELSTHRARCRAFEFIGNALPGAIILTGTSSLMHLRENVAAFEEVFGEIHSA